MDVFRLIYVSRVARPTRLVDVESIVSRACSRNTTNGITGILVYTPSHFLQALEGEESVVRATYERIRRDPRHTDVRIVDASAVPERRFESWGMVAQPLSGVSPRELEELSLPRALELLLRLGGSQ